MRQFNSDITKVNVTINGSPNRTYNDGIDGKDMWTEISRFFGTKNKGGRPNMNLTRYIAGNKFGLLIDLRSMADTSLHGNGVRLVNTKDGIHLEIKRETSGSENVHCHIYTISDSQMNIIDRQLQGSSVLKSYNISIWTRAKYHLTPLLSGRQIQEKQNILSTSFAVPSGESLTTSC